MSAGAGTGFHQPASVAAIGGPSLGWIDVTQAPYNADKTGASDASVAINSAITAGAALGGAIVYCPGGTYLLNASLLMKTNVRLVGEGMKRSLLKANFVGAGMVKQNAASTPNWTAEQLGFDMNSPSGTNAIYGVNISAANCDNVTVDRCEFKNFGTGTGDKIGILCNGAVSFGATFSNNSFVGPGAVAEDKTKGMWILFGKTFEVSGNNFAGCFRACNLENTTGYNVARFTISHNVVQSFGKYAFLMNGVEWGTVTGNNVSGSVYPGGAGDSSAGIGSGISGTQNSRYMTYAGNICNGCEVSAYDTEYVTITGNNVSLAQAACIEVGKSFMTVSPKNITISANICDGSVNGSNITIGNVDGCVCTGNVSSGCTGVAIRVIPNDGAVVCQRITISHNVARDSQYGITVTTAAGRAVSDVQITGNKCYGNSVDGIALSNLVDISNVQIEYNYCVGNAGVPINVPALPTNVRRYKNIETANDYLARRALTYGVSIATAVGATETFAITVTDGVAFTIANPTSNPDPGLSITYDIKNSSGGAHGVISMGAAFLLAGGGTQLYAGGTIANGKRRLVSFTWDGTNWIERSRTSADA